MRMKRYRDWPILPKIMTISVLSITGAALVGLCYWSPLMERTLAEGKSVATRQAVDVAYGILESYEAEVKSGQMTLEEAKTRAAGRIRNLRYGGKEYFWINDLDLRMVMHPTKPELEGKNLTDERDPHGKYLFREFARTANDKGAGFVDYLWPKPGDTRPVEKISYVKLFRPWGWIIGSGIYIDDVKGEVAVLRWKLAAGILLFGILTMLLALSIGRGITRSLDAVVSVLPQIAAGDLNQQVAVAEKNEIGRLADAINLMAANLREIVADIKSSTEEIVVSSNLLHNESERMAGCAEQTAEQSNIVAMASDEMSATSNEIARSCICAADSSQKASDLARTGNRIVQETVAGMNRIAERVRSSAATVESLGLRSDQIGEIVNTIEDIAEQTNLLALNAAIEAARAGDQGRGFAVVADEVRALADRTAKATREISGMIKVIQAETRTAVASIEEGVNEVRKGTIDAGRSGEALDEISSQINEVTMQVSQIATAAEQQCSTISEITGIIQQITSVIQETSSGTQGSAVAASQITTAAEDLRKQVGQFKTA